MSRIAFSTLACPDWTLQRVLQAASEYKYDGVELRFLEGEAALWKLRGLAAKRLTEARDEITSRGLEVVCVDTSCRFHWPEKVLREREIEEGARMAELAAGLGAPAIRVFGDSVQPGRGRDETRKWIAECMVALAERTRGSGVQIWLETHGDFASGTETVSILNEACPVSKEIFGAIWDPANCLMEVGESPREGGLKIGAAIRNVHLKDICTSADGKWEYVLTGEGNFPLRGTLDALCELRYDGPLTFEWEKKWHPELASAEIALPHFREWYRRNQSAR